MSNSYQEVVKEIETLMCNHTVDDDLIKTIWERYASNKIFRSEIDSRRSINIYFNYCFKKYIEEYLNKNIYQR